MKKYNRPNFEIAEFDVEEIMALSVVNKGEIDEDNATEFSVETETYKVETTDSYKM